MGPAATLIQLRLQAELHERSFGKFGDGRSVMHRHLERELAREVRSGERALWLQLALQDAPGRTIIESTQIPALADAYLATAARRARP